MEPNKFVRQMYLDCIKGKYREDEYFNMEEKDKHNFWYCVDNCWKSLNHLILTRLLYQMIIYLLKLDSSEHKPLQEKLLNYGKDHVSTWDEQIKEELLKFNYSEICEEFWWEGFG